VIGRFKLHDETFLGTAEATRVHGNESTYELSELRVLAPTCPSKIVGVGLNYTDYARELGTKLPEQPTIFLKPLTSVIGPGDSIVHPAISSRVDFEGELAVFIGRSGAHVEDSKRVVLGYTCLNDVTARDLQIEDGQWTRSKSFDTFAPLGSFVAPELDPRNARIVTRVNGRQRQSSNTRDLIFDVDFLVRFISRIMTFEVGDVIATGTPSGVGQLRPGDTVDIDITGIGTLSNNVISEQDEKLSATNRLKPHV
jgi:2-keto-4-pentenoate hydratase/2-oxohepta-3-ene-1,7-dioic acid hydratase in catechol pathway